MTETAAAVPRRIGPLAWVVILGAFAVLIALGTWQVQRLIWKENLLSTIAARIAADPVALQDVVERSKSGSDFEYVRVSLEGTFNHHAEQFFFATHGGQPGYFVYTPMTLAGGGTIFVNRGFVGMDRKDRSLRTAGLVEGEVSVTGLARRGLFEKPSILLPDNDPGKNIFYWKDIRAMAVNAGLDPDAASFITFFVDADDTPVAGGEPVGGVTQVSLPNNHLQYAITWYGLAAALAGVSGMVWWRQRR